MDLKKLFKTYGFWIAVASGLFLLFQFVFKCFGIVITEGGYMAVVNGILSIFVMLGIVSKPPSILLGDSENSSTENDENAKDTAIENSKSAKSQNSNFVSEKTQNEKDKKTSKTKDE